MPVPQSRIDRTLDEALNVLAWEAIVLLYAVIVVAPIALVVACLFRGSPAAGARTTVCWRRRRPTSSLPGAPRSR